MCGNWSGRLAGYSHSELPFSSILFEKRQFMRDALLERLRSGRVVLMDGAMGTELLRAGLQPGACAEAWNLTHPETVRAIHQSYVEAGAECLVTNTFQANETALAR